jgi:hypothetical protein
MSIQTISLRGRDQNLNNFCPFCGVRNSSLDGVQECPHLLFIYLNIADEMMYVKDGLFPGLSDDEVFENIHELVENLKIENAFILEEFVPVAGSQFLIGYQIQDED